MRWFCLVAALAAGSAALHAQCSGAPCIDSLQSAYPSSPASYGPAITAGTLTSDFWLFINGTFNTQYSNAVTWAGVGAPSGQELPLVDISNTQIVVDVPASLFASAGSANIRVTQFITGQIIVLSNTAIFTVNAPLTAQALPAGVVGQPYSQFLATGGTAPYYLQLVNGATPPGITSPYQLTQNDTSLSGIPTTPGDYTFSVQILDEWENAITANYELTILSPALPPLVITTSSPLTSATVGVTYANQISATGGDGQYYFSLAGGSLPAGLTLDSSSGQLSGTPTSPGTVRFTVQVNDNSNHVASKTFTLTVSPQPLIITTPPFSSMTVGTALNVTFTAQGGVQPYSFSSSGTLPPNAQFNSSGQLTATLNTPGTYAFTVTVTDSVRTTASQGYTITVTGTALSIVTASPLSSGQTGVAYPGVQFQARGGFGSYTWTAVGTPPGLTLSASGALSGTPTTSNSYNMTVTVTDGAKATASGNFGIIILNSLAITTASLPNGTLGVAYSSPNMAATGGIGTLTWSASGLPAGITLSAAGAFSGTPTAAGTAQVSVTVTDAQGNTASQSYALIVNAAPLSINPATAGTTFAATVGSSFSLGFTVTGGVQPYSFSASGLPAGLSISSSTGTISGAPTAPGNSSVTVTVKDSTGVTASTNFSVNIGLPTTPPLSFTGISSSLNPGSQSTLGVSIGSAFPVDVTVTLTLKFTGTDPAVQFATGGTTATLTVPAGKTASATTVGVQTGTVAGTITITAKLTAGGTDITPSPAPTSTVTIPATAPVISSITATRNSTGFTVTIVGYSSTLALSTANFTFTGTNLATSSLAVSVNTLFTAWYSSSAAGQFGSNFTYTQPFTASNPQAITSVSVTLVNAIGTSTSASATLQ